MKKSIFISIVLFTLSGFMVAQRPDSLQQAEDSAKVKRQNKRKIYSRPRTASIMSALVPGLGQAYNKKYWKIPLIYAGLGGFGYMFVTNNEEYNKYRQNVIAEYDGDSTTINSMPWYSGEQLQQIKLDYKKYRDFGIIGFSIFYLLNIIDANVDAHLKTFDVSDDLSLHFEPWQKTVRTPHAVHNVWGLSIKLNFK